MKIFPVRNMPSNVQEIFATAQAQLKEARDAKPQELVAVKTHMGGYEMQLHDVPAGQEFMLVR